MNEKNYKLLTWIVAFFAFPFLLFQTESVIVAGIPMRVHFHVFLTFGSSFFVIFGLFFARQIVPLYKKIENGYGLVLHI